MPMDQIVIQNMAFHGYHGVLPEESVTGNRFLVSVWMTLDLHQAGESDDVEHTVNYAQVYETVRFIVEGPRKQLIEALAESIASRLLQQFPRIHAISVEVGKPTAPIPGIFDGVSVKIYRMRQT